MFPLQVFPTFLNEVKQVFLKKSRINKENDRPAIILSLLSKDQFLSNYQRFLNQTFLNISANFGKVKAWAQHCLFTMIKE